MSRLKLLALLLPVALSSHAFAQKRVATPNFTEWHDLAVNDMNRLPLHADFFPFRVGEVSPSAMPRKADSRNFLSLDGDWKFLWVANADERPDDFYRVDLDDSKWGVMPVPGMWELNGYGDPEYVNIGFAWRGHFQGTPPDVPVKDNHVGSYRRHVTLPADWAGRQVICHLGSVTSSVYLYVNGQFAGYAEDAKVAAEFDITRLLHEGDNLIAFQVFRWSDGSWCEDQDFWRLSGVARESYLFARDKERHFDDIRLTPTLSSDFADGNLHIWSKHKVGLPVKFRLYAPDGSFVSERTFDTEWRGYVDLDMQVYDVKKWSAETPDLYTLVCSTPAEETFIKVGFRDVRIEGGQLKVNGQPILIKGVNRHEIDPDGGYVVSAERMEDDLRIMKRLNVNAIRTSHYPDDPRFYDMCDRYGFYVVAEANQESHGFGYEGAPRSKDDDFALQIIQRNQHNVSLLRNHPSVIIWSLGNETAMGPNFLKAYQWVRSTDPTRPIQFEQAGTGDGTDIFCPMYLSVADCKKYLDSGAAKPLILCEYNHTMGNSGGNLADYWELVRQYPSFQGGFDWDFADQALHRHSLKPMGVRPDGMSYSDLRKIEYCYGGDYNEYDPSDNNFNCNGVVGPDRQLNPHAYELAYQYQDVWATLAGMSADGVTLSVRNENFFRSLADYDMAWSLLIDGREEASGVVSTLSAAPQASQDVSVAFPHGLLARGEAFLNLDFRLKVARPLMNAGQVAAQAQIYLGGSWNPAPQAAVKAKVKVANNGGDLTLSAGDATVVISGQTGLVSSYARGSVVFISDGATIRPNFWRAPTDNDMGAGLHRLFALWRNPQLVLTSLTSDHDKKAGTVSAVAKFSMPSVKSSLTIEYSLRGSDGSLSVRQTLTPNPGAQVPGMFRHGLAIQLPDDMNISRFYGRGPVENYPDRRECMRIGVYSLSADDQCFPYIRPQESGTKGDMRWWKQMNEAGDGLMVTADSVFFASAIPYDISALDDGDDKAQNHSFDVKRSNFTNLFIDSEHCGIAGTDSWGAWPLEHYRVTFSPKTVSIRLTPLSE